MDKALRFIALALALGIWFGTPFATAGDKGAQGEKQGNYDGNKGGHQGDKRDEGEKLLQAFTEKLQLSQPQQDKIKPILTEMVEQIRAAKQDKSATHEQKSEKAMAARKAGYDKVAAELTPEQRAKFDKHRAGLEGGDKGQKHQKDGQKSGHKEG